MVVVVEEVVRMATPFAFEGGLGGSKRSRCSSSSSSSGDLKQAGSPGISANFIAAAVSPF
jgi:hypothetical protein